MGWNVSWLAVRGMDKALAFQRLSLVENEVVDELDVYPFMAADFPGGWTIIFSDRSDWASNERARGLSAEGALVIGTAMSESVMYSETFAYEGGVLRWRVAYDCETDGAIDVDGEPPAELAEIHAGLAEQQRLDDEADYIFEVPLALGAALHGYRVDEPRPNPPPFRRLTDIGEKAKGKSLFGWLTGEVGR